jgi:hypothetical protein
MINTQLPSFDHMFEGTSKDRFLSTLRSGIILIGTSCLIKRESDGFIWAAGKITALDDHYLEMEIDTDPNIVIHLEILLDYSNKLLFLI